MKAKEIRSLWRIHSCSQKEKLVVKNPKVNSMA